MVIRLDLDITLTAKTVKLTDPMSIRNGQIVIEDMADSKIFTPVIKVRVTMKNRPIGMNNENGISTPDLGTNNPAHRSARISILPVKNSLMVPKEFLGLEENTRLLAEEPSSFPFSGVVGMIYDIDADRNHFLDFKDSLNQILDPILARMITHPDIGIGSVTTQSLGTSHRPKAIGCHTRRQSGQNIHRMLNPVNDLENTFVEKRLSSLKGHRNTIVEPKPIQPSDPLIDRKTFASGRRGEKATVIVLCDAVLAGEVAPLHQINSGVIVTRRQYNLG
jgi:hypothetical protein